MVFMTLVIFVMSKVFMTVSTFSAPGHRSPRRRASRAMPT